MIFFPVHFSCRALIVNNKFFLVIFLVIFLVNNNKKRNQSIRIFHKIPHITLCSSLRQRHSFHPVNQYIIQLLQRKTALFLPTFSINLFLASFLASFLAYKTFEEHFECFKSPYHGISSINRSNSICIRSSSLSFNER